MTKSHQNEGCFVSDLVVTLTKFVNEYHSSGKPLISVRDVARIRTAARAHCPPGQSVDDAFCDPVMEHMASKVAPAFPLKELSLVMLGSASNSDARTFIRKSPRFAPGLYGFSEEFATKANQEMKKAKRKLGKQLNMAVLDELREALTSIATSLGETATGGVTEEDLRDFEWLWCSLSPTSKGADKNAKDIGSFVLPFAFKQETAEDLDLDGRLRGVFKSVFKERMEGALAGPGETRKTALEVVERLVVHLSKNFDGSERLFFEVGVGMRFLIEHRKYIGTSLVFPRTFVRTLCLSLAVKDSGRKRPDLARPLHDLLGFYFLGAPVYCEATLASSRKFLAEQGILLQQPEESPRAKTPDEREAIFKLLRLIDETAMAWTKTMTTTGGRRPSITEVRLFLRQAEELRGEGGELGAMEIGNLVRLTSSDGEIRRYAETLGLAICGDAEGQTKFVTIFARPETPLNSPRVQEEVHGLLGNPSLIVEALAELSSVFSVGMQVLHQSRMPWRYAVEWRAKTTRSLRRSLQSVILTSLAELTTFVASKLQDNDVLAKYLLSGVSGRLGTNGVEKLRAELITKQRLFFDENEGPPTPKLPTPIKSNPSSSSAELVTSDEVFKHPSDVVVQFGVRLPRSRLAELEAWLSSKVAEIGRAVRVDRVLRVVEHIAEDIKSKLPQLQACATETFSADFATILRDLEVVARPAAEAISEYIAGKLLEKTDKTLSAWKTLNVMFGLGRFLRARAEPWQAAKCPWPMASTRELVRHFRRYLVDQEVLLDLDVAVRTAFPEGPVDLLVALLYAVVEEEKPGLRGRVRRVYEVMRRSELFVEEEAFDFETWKIQFLAKIQIDQLAMSTTLTQVLESLPERVREDVDAEAEGSSLVDVLAYLDDKYTINTTKKTSTEWRESEVYWMISTVVDGIKTRKDHRIAKVALLWTSTTFEDFMSRVAKLASCVG